MNWRIDTENMPKDGTKVLVCLTQECLDDICQDNNPVMIYWDTHGKYWDADGFCIEEEDVETDITHWMPTELPEIPSKSDKV